MNEDTRRVELTPEGVVLVGFQMLNLSALKSRKTRVEGEILSLQRRQRSLQNQIDSNNETIRELEFELASYNSVEINEWVEEQEKERALQKERGKREKLLANQKAKAFLKEYLGEENYGKLMKDGKLNFTGRDGRGYEITSKGVLYRGTKRMCVIHPRNLPLPDFIISVLTTAKEGRL